MVFNAQLFILAICRPHTSHFNDRDCATLAMISVSSFGFIDDVFTKFFFFLQDRASYSIINRSNVGFESNGKHDITNGVNFI